MRIAGCCAAALFAVGCGGAGSMPAAARCEITVPTLRTGKLHADGTQLRDELGRVVSLRGANAGSRSKFAPYVPFDFEPGDFPNARDAYLDRAMSLGFDVLRVPFNWAAVEPSRGADDQVFIHLYDNLLVHAWRRRIRTIVDFHQDVYAENFCGDGFPAWTLPGNPPAPHHDCPKWYEAYATPDVEAAFDRFFAGGSPVQEDYLALWQRMAERYRNFEGVIGFEPMNEPSAGSQPPADFERTTLPAFYARVLPMLRATAPEALLFVDPLGMTSATHHTNLPKPDGSNIVYAPHYYQPLTIFGGDGRADLVEDDLRALVAPREAWGVPAFIGEWGAADSVEGSVDLVAAHLAAFDALGLGGAQWQYSVAREKWNAEPLDLVRADGTPSPMAAAWLRPYASAVDGTIIETTWDPEARRFLLRYRPAGGITEVTVPPGAAPSGWDLRVTGACADDGYQGWVFLRADGAGEVRFELIAK